MSKTVAALSALAGVVAIAVVVLDLPVPWRLDVLLGGVAFAWLLVVLTLPWDVHFQAVDVLRELDRSIERGLQPRTTRAQVVRIARRTLVVSLALHLGSAGAVAFAAWWWSQWQTGGWLAAIYLASTVLRPIGAWYRHVRQALHRSLGEVTHPRDDVLALRSRIEQLELLGQEVHRLSDRVELLARELGEEDRRLDRRLDQVGRRFEETLEHLTDNRELLAGVRAFLRMVREPAAPRDP
ncbi:MAG: hypothetical protein ABMA64_07910 [Myxococcota bacterium]